MHVPIKSAVVILAKLAVKSVIAGAVVAGITVAIYEQGRKYAEKNNAS